MFDGSHNFAITFLYAKGSVQANISSDVLPTVNFIQPVQLRALYMVSVRVGKRYGRVPQGKQLMLWLYFYFTSFKDITAASLKTELIVKDSAHVESLQRDEHNF